MRRKIIKLKFVDLYPGFVPEHSALFKVISRNYDIHLCDNPDYIIAQPYGHEHLRYDCIKIFFTGENMTPDFNLCDYAIGFDHLSFGDRYLRVPLWAIRSNFSSFRMQSEPSDEDLLNRGFCSFVVSNSRGDPMRTRFLKELSKYKKIDSGGCYMNNVGGPVKDKLKFIAGYKFNIAFENSAYPGYTTEKIMDPLSVWSVPVYWGDPLVDHDFRKESMVRVCSTDDIDAAIDEIIRLDKNDAEYLKKCREQCLVIKDKNFYMDKLEEFMVNIFEQPIDAARRTSRYGYQGVFYRAWQKKAFAAYDLVNAPMNFCRKVRRSLHIGR